MGPSPEATSCEGCIGNNVSTFGVCLECILGLVSNDDHTRCETYTARKAIQRQVFVSWHANRSCCWPVAAKCTKAQSQARSLRPRLSAAAPTNIVSKQWTLFACLVLQSVSEWSVALADNASEQTHICYHGGYDASVHSLALANQIANFQKTGQGCDTCPVDIIGEGCLSCRGGISMVSPGFMVPRITADSKRRLAELPLDAVAGDGDKVAGVFR